MGMFDTVIVECPHCLAGVSVQSKSGPCDLLVFELGDAPDSVLYDLEGECCQCACGQKFVIEAKTSICIHTRKVSKWPARLIRLGEKEPWIVWKGEPTDDE